MARRAQIPLEAALVKLALVGLAALMYFGPPCPLAALYWQVVLQASRNFLSRLVDGVVEVTGQERLRVLDGERLLFAAGLSTSLACTWWLANAFLFAATKMGMLERFRIRVSQPPPPPELVRECVLDAVLGQLLVRPLLLFAAYPIFVAAGMRADLASLPGCRQLLLQVFVCMQVDDALFYWFHRALHLPCLYRRIHKKHHKFGHTVGVAVEYSHPVEDLLNAVATMAGPLALGCHMSVVWLYPTMKLAQSIDSHSGYDLPFPLSIWSAIEVMDCAPAHSFHHSHNTGMYGGYFRTWDRLCGTDATYDEYSARASGAAKKPR